MAQCNLTAASGNGSVERQYIGARYVPQFFENPNGTWDWLQGVAYEPLTIVQYAENSYTSKKKVPANVGSPNLNPEYWAQTGNYNGALLSIQTEVSGLKNEVTLIKSFKGRKFYIISDSYGLPFSGVDRWDTNFGSALENLGGLYTFDYSPGAGFTVAGNTFLQMLSSLDSSFTDVLIVGGFNDGGQTTSTLLPAISEFVNQCRLKNPLIQIHMAFVACSTTPAQRTILLSTYDIEKRIFEELGCNFGTDAFLVLHDKSAMAADGKHPVSAGMNLIALYLKKWILGGKDEVMYITNNYIIVNGYITFTPTIHIPPNTNILLNNITEDVVEIPSQLFMTNINFNYSFDAYMLGEKPGYYHANVINTNLIVMGDTLSTVQFTGTGRDVQHAITLNAFQF